MAEELKVCPFCGGIPKTSHRPESEASGGGHVAFVVCYCGGYASTAHQMGHAETVQAAIAKVVEKWNTRAQLPSQGGEAVEVVAYGDKQQLNALKSECSASCAVWNAPGRNREPLMTVAQHQRILAAATHPADQVADDLTMVKVSRELLERAERNLCSGDEAYQAQRELRALLNGGRS